LKEKPVTISIITATWNSIDTIGVCLESINTQTYGLIEHIVVDGNSVDGTLIEISNKSPKSKVFSEKDDGIYDALNKGIELASGEVIGFLHSDDFFSSDNVVSIIASAFDNRDICAVYGDLVYVKKTDSRIVVRKWRGSKFRKIKLLLGWMPAHPTLYVRKEWYSKIGLFSSDFSISGDYDSVLKLFSNPDFVTLYIPTNFVTMRLGGVSNKFGIQIFRKINEDYRAVLNSGIPPVWAFCIIILKNVRKIPQYVYAKLPSFRISK
jgi:glycosyltransferase involved in cell wall biosynthesis